MNEIDTRSLLSLHAKHKHRFAQNVRAATSRAARQCACAPCIAVEASLDRTSAGRAIAWPATLLQRKRFADLGRSVLGWCCSLPQPHPLGAPKPQEQ